MYVRLTAAALALALVGSTSPAFAQYPQDRGHEQHWGWDQAPNDFRDVQREAFHDGIEAARRDFYQGRRPDPDQHREFRQPTVPPPDREPYREAFRRGYMTAIEHMRQEHDRDYDAPR